MRNINRIKAQSDITAVILISLIVILIITLIYPTIVDLIESSPFLSPQSCEDITSEKRISMEVSCYNPLTKDLEVTITKKSKSPIDSIDFRMEFGEEMRQWRCNSNCTNCEVLDEGEKTYYFFPEKMPNTLTVLIDGCSLKTEEVISCE